MHCFPSSEYNTLVENRKSNLGKVLIRNRDLTRGKPDLKSSKSFFREDCQQNRSLEVPTSIVVSKKNNPNIDFEGGVFSLLDRF